MQVVSAHSHAITNVSVSELNASFRSRIFSFTARNSDWLRAARTSRSLSESASTGFSLGRSYPVAGESLGRPPRPKQAVTGEKGTEGAPWLTQRTTETEAARRARLLARATIAASPPSAPGRRRGRGTAR